jgi:hypothetical protein
MVMRDITAYYKSRVVPGLRRIKILSDGCRAQYKGKNNFRLLGTFHLHSQGIVARQKAADADSRTAMAAMQELRQLESESKLKASCSSSLNATDSVGKQLILDYRMASSGGEMASADTPFGVFQVHDFPQSHHYGGPHDNAGKVPRTKMRRAEAFEKARISDYHACFEFCIKHMPRYSQQYFISPTSAKSFYLTARLISQALQKIFD